MVGEVTDNYLLIFLVINRRGAMQGFGAAETLKKGGECGILQPEVDVDSGYPQAIYPQLSDAL